MTVSVQADGRQGQGPLLSAHVSGAAHVVVAERAVGVVLHGRRRGDEPARQQPDVVLWLRSPVLRGVVIAPFDP